MWATGSSGAGCPSGRPPRLRSRPTARRSPVQGRPRCGFGTWARARNSTSGRDTTVTSGPWRSRPTAGSWPQQPFSIRSCTSGTQPRAGRFAPDGKGVTVPTDTGLVIEEATTGRPLATIPGNLGRPLAFSADGRLVAVATGTVVESPLGGLGGGWRVEGVSLAEVATGKEI